MILETCFDWTTLWFLKLAWLLILDLSLWHHQNKLEKHCFHKFILIDTNSVSIKHFTDTDDPNLNTYSTIQILNVLQPRQFGTNLNQPKKLFAPFDPIGYTYWDYVDAWMNVFWLQNNKFKHSWLIYFQIGSSNGGISLDQIQRSIQSKSNKGLTNLKECSILRNQESLQIWCVFLALHYCGYSHGSTDMGKQKATSNFHHCKDTHLSSGGINLIHPKQHQIK